MSSVSSFDIDPANRTALLRLPRPFLRILALLFAVANISYSLLWMAAFRTNQAAAPVELGIRIDYVPQYKALKVLSVFSNSSALKAGIQVGDLITAVDGAPLIDEQFQDGVWRRHRPGDRIRLTIQRSAAPPFVVEATFEKPANPMGSSLGEQLAGQLHGSFPLPFLLVGLTVLFLRVDDPIVWLLALMFAGFIATPLPRVPLPLPPFIRPLIIGYKTLAMAFLCPVCYYFFSVFPRRSPLDRRAPWLKSLAFAATLFFVLPPYRNGIPRLPIGPAPTPQQTFTPRSTIAFMIFWLFAGLISLTFNYFFAKDEEARRKLRIIFWGTIVGVVPIAVEEGISSFIGMASPDWVVTAFTLVTFLVPLSFAYAVVKHRVLDLPVLLKRSARYLLVQRGFTFLLSALSIVLTLLFASSLNSYSGWIAPVSQTSAVALGAVFGTAILWGGTQLHRKISNRIDRAFFRSAYDASRILEDLSTDIPTVTDPAHLAQLLNRQICHALQPRHLCIYFRQPNGDFQKVSGSSPSELETLPGSLPVLADLAHHHTSLDYPSPGQLSNPLLAPLQPECLTPMLGRDDQLVGFIILGQRLSEEPYSAEDKRLLGAAASQAATALDNVWLAREIAERLDAERRAAREMEIARDVQARLLPQTAPRLPSLACAAQCIQARSVGGDYFDFLQFDSRHLGLVLADVSGKGVHAALLVANLQAYLRSQTVAGVLDPAQSLQLVNRMLFATTATEHYATLFYGIYDDSARRLAYVNCGHNPPILVRQDGTIERLPATALAIGLFQEWECSVAEIQFGPGDMLVVFSDGVTEASQDNNEFGEDRLIALLKANRQRPESEIVSLSLAEIQQFCSGILADDMTMLIARADA